MDDLHPNVVPFRAEEPQPLVREIPPGDPFPEDDLGPLNEVVMAVAGVTQAPVAIPAASALAVASLAVQGHADVETLAGRSPLSIYLMTSALSGERKSSCDAKLMRGVHDHVAALMPGYRDALQSWQNAHAVWKGDRDRALAEIKKGVGTDRIAAEADLHALGPEPPAPLSPDRVVTEPTFEGLTRLFVEAQPSLGLLSDEGGQFLGGFAMSTDNRLKTQAALNDLWQGNPIRRTRAGEGHRTLYERRLAINLMAQPVVIHSVIGDPQAVGTGFLARFLLCEPASTIGTRVSSNTRRDDGAIEAFNAKIQSILDIPLLLNTELGGLAPRLLSLTPEARALLTEFADKVEVEMGPDGKYSHITGTASKIAEQACRIAGVLTLFNDITATEVSGNAMADGISLSGYYLDEAARLASAATTTPKVDAAEKLRLWLRDVWRREYITVRAVVRRGPNALREAPTAKAAIALLVEHGWLVPVKDITVDGHRASEAWRVVR